MAKRRQSRMKPENLMKIVTKYYNQHYGLASLINAKEKQKVEPEKTLLELTNEIETLSLDSIEESIESDDEDVKEPTMSRYTEKKEEKELSSESEEESSESDESDYWDNSDSEDDTDDEN